jgi:5-methylcytosine-specific restriction endonuclease McrA
MAHAQPGITLDQLIHNLTELGLEAFKPIKPVAAPRPNSKSQIQREIWERDNGQCTNCGSMYAIEEDHRHPKGKGGQHTIENMRLLCRSCNQRAAVTHYGMDKMAPHLRVE